MLGLLDRLKMEVLIGAGATSTNLASKGYSQTESVQWWIINHPDAYQELIRAWVSVGCHCIASPTSGANRLRLKAFGLDERTDELNRGVAKLTKEIVPDTCYLGFALSSAVVFLPPMGDATAGEVYQSYVEQIAISEDIGCDYYEVQCTDLEQAGLAIKAVKALTKLPLMALVHSLNRTPKGFRTMMGLDPATAARRYEELGADAIGMMCGGVNYEETTAVLREMGAVCHKPLTPRPNAGIPELINGKAVHPGTPEAMARAAVDWVKAGARLVAGCCGTTPEHIARVIAALKKSREEEKGGRG